MATVKVAVLPEHIVVEPLNVATGNSCTVIAMAAEFIEAHVEF